jgi:hypothetical protein
LWELKNNGLMKLNSSSRNPRDACFYRAVAKE